MLARFLDGLVVGVTVTVVASLLGVSGGVRTAVTALLGVTYETVAIAVSKRTLGKSVCRIEVAGVGNSDVSWLQAGTRAVVLLGPIYLVAPRVDTVAEWAVLLFLIANFVVVARRRTDRRGIHDLAAGTRPVAVAPLV